MEDDKPGILRRCHLFAGAQEESMAPLASASVAQTFGPDTPVFSVGDEPDGLRIVLSGGVRVWISDRDGRELTIAFMGPKDAFGEIALLDGLPRTANVTALDKTRCLFLPAAAFERALEIDPALARQVIYSLCELLRRNLGTLSGLAFSGLGARLASKLNELALDHAEIVGNEARFIRRFSQTDLAQLLGVTREAYQSNLPIYVVPFARRRLQSVSGPVAMIHWPSSGSSVIV